MTIREKNELVNGDNGVLTAWRRHQWRLMSSCCAGACNCAVPSIIDLYRLALAWQTVSPRLPGFVCVQYILMNDCGTLGIVLFKLEWDGRYRTVLAVKCNRQNRIPMKWKREHKSLFLICAQNQQCIKNVDWQNCAKSRCNDDAW